MSTHDILKTIILTDSTLNSSIGTNKIYKFEPKLKGSGFNGFPYIVINIPSSPDIENTVLERTSKLKTFEVIVELVMEWSARGNVEDYCNRIINVIESNVDTLKTSGYYDTEIVLDNINDEEVRDSKEVIRSTFTIAMRGNVLI